MKIERVDRYNLTDADIQALAELFVEVWPKPRKGVEFRRNQLHQLFHDYSGPESDAPVSFVIRDGAKFLAHAGAIPRRIRTHRGELKIAGLSRVCSAPSERGKGMGEMLVREVFSLVDNDSYAFCLFQTSLAVRPFYEKLGCMVINNSVINSLAESPAESPFTDELVMAYPRDKSWPEGEIDLRGPGF